MAGRSHLRARLFASALAVILIAQAGTPPASASAIQSNANAPLPAAQARPTPAAPDAISRTRATSSTHPVSGGGRWLSARREVFVEPVELQTDDPTVEATIGGPAVSVTTTVAGQNATITFAGTANQRVSWQWGTFSLSPNTAPDITISKPDGSVLRAKDQTGQNEFYDVLTLPATGTYTILVDHRTTVTGTVTLTVIYDVPADVTEAATIGGPAVSVTTTTPGQNATITFAGTANQRVSWQWGTFTLSPNTAPDITIKKPDGSVLRAKDQTGQNEFYDVLTLPATGTYTILVDPRSNVTGTVTLTTIYDVPADVTEATTIGGPAVSVTTTTPGQNATITFAGTANQRVSWQWGTPIPVASGP